MVVYLLEHSTVVEKGVKSSFIIGVYSSKEIAKQKISKYKKIDGFKDFPDNFYITSFRVVSSKNNPSELDKPIFFLQHEYSIGDYDYITYIDMYFDYCKALDRIEHLKKKRKYKKCTNGLYSPDGFVVDKYFLNQDNWEEGFTSN